MSSLVELTDGEIAAVAGGSSIVVVQSQSNSESVTQTGSPGTINWSDVVQIKQIHIA